MNVTGCSLRDAQPARAGEEGQASEAAHGVQRVAFFLAVVGARNDVMCHSALIQSEALQCGVCPAKCEAGYPRVALADVAVWFARHGLKADECDGDHKVMP